MADNSVILQSLVPKVLGAKELTIAHCDRLLQILARHVEDAADSLSVGFLAEYVSLRDVLHRFEAAPETAGPLLLDELVEGTLQRFTAADFVAEVDALNRFFSPLVKRRQRFVREFAQLQADLQRAAGEMKALSSLLNSVSPFVDARCRDLIRIAGTRCLIALRRWQLDHHGQPPLDLLTMCKAAGINEVPIDEFSEVGNSLRFVMLDGEFVVYSVAKDGQDDGGELDWNFGMSAGDWLFRLPPVQ